jgi:hypothetical protein
LGAGDVELRLALFVSGGVVRKVRGKRVRRGKKERKGGGGEAGRLESGVSGGVRAIEGRIEKGGETSTYKAICSARRR